MLLLLDGQYSQNTYSVKASLNVSNVSNVSRQRFFFSHKASGGRVHHVTCYALLNSDNDSNDSNT